MSGGNFNYKNDALCHEIFGWAISPDYGRRGASQSKIARKLNPLEDKIISELVWDVFCLLHSFDWYQCGDTSEDTYIADVNWFKKKWLGKPTQKLVTEQIDMTLIEAREELMRILGYIQADEATHDET